VSDQLGGPHDEGEHQGVQPLGIPRHLLLGAVVPMTEQLDDDRGAGEPAVDADEVVVGQPGRRSRENDPS
jgi:hypothetical protein